VIVVAAGNSNADVATSSPANCQGVIAVAAVDRSGGKASYSNYGAGITLAAPGGGGGTDGVLSTWNTGTTTPGADAYAYASGTSMATPHVSAVAALMFSANPGLKPGQVERLLQSSARAFPATCSSCGAGIVNAGAAVSSAIAALHPSLVSSANPSVAGSLVTFTVTVTGDSPTGAVQFMDGSNALGSPVDLSAATSSTSTASLDVSSLAVGSHSITAVYLGDANNAGVTSTALTQAVQATSSTVLTSSAATTSLGATITFTATVSSASPTGTVQFKDGGVALGSAVALSSAAASYSTNALAVGSHSITAVYSGDANNVGSTSGALTQTVAQVASSTALNASSASLTQGQTLILTATVSGYAPTGSVQFKDGGVDLGGTVTLVDGSASYATNTLIVGSHSITAVYLGDANNVGSTSAVAGVSVVAAVAGPSGGVGGGVDNADIPTLPQWGLILLGCVLVGLAQRRRPQKARRA
jgi:hypothetical protein